MNTDSLKNIIHKVHPHEDDEDVMSSPVGRYQRTPNKSEFGIDFVKPDGTRFGFAYSGLVRRELKDGTTITLRFIADGTWEVTITGRKLERLFDLIRSHRFCEVREAARDMGQDSEAIVTKLEVERVEE